MLFEFYPTSVTLCWLQSPYSYQRWMLFRWARDGSDVEYSRRRWRPEASKAEVILGRGHQGYRNLFQSLGVLTEAKLATFCCSWRNVCADPLSRAPNRDEDIVYLFVEVQVIIWLTLSHQRDVSIVMKIVCAHFLQLRWIVKYRQYGSDDVKA